MSLSFTQNPHYPPVSEHLDNQKELLEEMYEEKLKILKESLTSFYQEEIQVSLPHPVPTAMQTSVTWLSEMNKIVLIFIYWLIDFVGRGFSV